MEILKLGATVGADTSEYESKMKGVQNTAGQTKDAISQISAAGSAMSVTLGNLASSAIQSVVSGLGNIIPHALEVVGSNERMGASYEALLAREIRNNSAFEKKIFLGNKWVTTGGAAAGTTDTMTKSQLKYADALDSADVAQARYQKLLVGIKEAHRGKKESEDAFNARLNLMHANAGKLEGTLAKLNTTIGKNAPAAVGAATEASRRLVAQYKTETGYTLTKQQAYEQAAVQAKTLMKWTERLAIDSPFNKADIAEGFKMAMAYGMNSKEAKLATQRVVDFAAGTGQSTEAVGGLLFAMGQIHNSDKLNAQDLRQLMNRGVDVNAVLKQMGTSFSKVGKSAVDSKKFLELLGKSMEDDFGGAAKKQANTISGLVASLQDLGDIATEDVFKPILDKARPAIEAIVNALSNESVKSALQMFGGWVGTLVGGPLGVLAGIVSGAATGIEKLTTALKNGDGPVTGMRDALKGMFPPELGPMIDRVARGVSQIRYAFLMAKDPVKSLKLGLEDIFGKQFVLDMTPMIEWAAGIPAALKLGLERVQKGDFIGALKAWMSGTVKGAITWAATVSKWIGDLVDEIRKGEYITKVGNAIGTWISDGVKGIGDAAKDEDITSSLKKLAGNIGRVAGTLLGAIGDAVKTWAYELADFQKNADDGKIHTGLANFIGRLVVAASNVKLLMADVGAALSSQLIASMFNEDPKSTALLQEKTQSYVRMMMKVATPKDAANVDEGVTSGFSWIGEQLWAGLKGGFAGMAEDWGDITKSITDGVKVIATALGIQSPSTYTRDELGKPLGDGVIVGAIKSINEDTTFSAALVSWINAAAAVVTKLVISVTPVIKLTNNSTGLPGGLPMGASAPMASTSGILTQVAQQWGLVPDALGLRLPTPVTVSIPMNIVTTQGVGEVGDSSAANPGADIGMRIATSLASTVSGAAAHNVMSFAVKLGVENASKAARDSMDLSAAPYEASVPYTIGYNASVAMDYGLRKGMLTLSTTLVNMQKDFSVMEKYVSGTWTPTMAGAGSALAGPITKNFQSFTSSAVLQLNSSLSIVRSTLQAIVTLMGQVTSFRVPSISPSAFSTTPNFGPPTGPPTGTNTVVSDNTSNQGPVRRDLHVNVQLGSKHIGKFVQEMVGDEATYDASRYYN